MTTVLNQSSNQRKKTKKPTALEIARKHINRAKRKLKILRGKNGK
jgi:hypothetical protein